MAKTTVDLLEYAGLNSSILGMRNPTKTRGRSDSYTDVFGNFILGEDDERLAKRLLSQGSVHGKFQRGIVVWLDIEAPRYIWSELDTYVVGVSPISSESTMYTLTKECKAITADMFSDSTPKEAVWAFKTIVETLENSYGSRKNIPIDVLKAVLPEGWMQKRTKVFSYQTLASVYHYRKDHRLPEWQMICEAIEKLPYAKELLLIGK